MGAQSYGIRPFRRNRKAVVKSCVMLNLKLTQLVSYIAFIKAAKLFA